MSNFVIKSVSIPMDMATFLDNNPDLSLSKIIQQRLKEIINQKALYENKNRVLENRLQVLGQKLYEANEEIERLKNTPLEKNGVREIHS